MLFTVNNYLITIKKDLLSVINNYLILINKFSISVINYRPIKPILIILILIFSYRAAKTGGFYDKKLDN